MHIGRMKEGFALTEKAVQEDRDIRSEKPRDLGNAVKRKKAEAENMCSHWESNSGPHLPKVSTPPLSHQQCPRRQLKMGLKKERWVLTVPKTENELLTP